MVTEPLGSPADGESDSNTRASNSHEAHCNEFSSAAYIMLPSPMVAMGKFDPIS
jgi:hypothetical protein